MTTSTLDTPRRTGGAAHPGPPLAAPAIAGVLTFLAGISIGPITGAGTTPSPYSGTAEVVGYFRDHATVAATSGWLFVLSATALAVLAAVAYSRLTFLAPNAPGPAIAGVGGVLAAGSLGLSGVLTWVSSRTVVTDRPDLTHAVHYLSFATGGPLHTASLGVFVLGLAVTTLFVRRTPRALSLVGIGIAAIDLASTVTFLVAGAAPLVPVGRFASLAWLVAISLLIPRTRAARR